MLRASSIKIARIVRDWPMHLLELNSGIELRTHVNSVLNITNKIENESMQDEYSIATAVDHARNLRTWIKTCISEGLTLSSMDQALEELEKTLELLYVLYDEVNKTYDTPDIDPEIEGLDGISIESDY